MILYIDPGTGSMLITIVISLLGTVLYFLRNAFMKLKFFAKGEKVNKNADKIPLVIYSDHKRYWNVFEPICDELEKRGIDTVFMTQSEDDPAFDKEYKHIKTEFIGEGSKGFAKLNNLNAKVVLSTTPSLDVFQWKRSKNVNYYVHIAHMPNDIITYRMFGLDYYDAILLSGEYQKDQIRKLEEIRNLPEKEIEFVGLPYMDSMKERIESNNNSTKHETTVIMAPSWGPNGLLSKYGSKLIDILVDTGYKIIIRPHPQSFTAEKEMIEELQKNYPDSDKLSWNTDTDNFDVLNESDVLISDFSGVIFDFSLVFDKPVIYTEPDFDGSIYDSAWLDEELWTFKILPKIGALLSEDNFENIKEIIDKSISSSEYEEGRNTARKETWMYMGEGKERVVDYLEKTLGKFEDVVEEEEEKFEETLKISEDSVDSVEEIETINKTEEEEE